MNKLESYIGKIVFLNLEKDFTEKNEILFRTNNNPHIFALMTAIDDLGIFVENPNWTSKKTASKEPVIRKIEFLIPWRYIISIGLFSDIELNKELGVSEINSSSIGFF